jgi:simple sugar transport system permease protein
MAERFKEALAVYGLPRTIITSFFIIVCLMAVALSIPFPALLSDMIVRLGMNGIMVLAMVPAILCGVGLNFGLPVGVLCGIIGMLTAIEMDLRGFPSFWMSLVIAIPLAVIFGWGYGWLLNKVKGSEMMVATYVGFSAVSLMNIGWIVLPYTNLELKWPIGKGLRTTVNIAGRMDRVLNDFWNIKIGTFHISLGLIGFLLFWCLLVWLFLRSKTGMAMKAVGDSRQFAVASGLSVDRYRIIGTIMSTVLGAIGISAYAQSFGFMQLYDAPMFYGFGAVAAILIGGATVRRAAISHVMIGTFLFQGLLVVALPVANLIMTGGNLAEITRITISNGVILYALTQVTGGE